MLNIPFTICVPCSNLCKPHVIHVLPAWQCNRYEDRRTFINNTISNFFIRKQRTDLHRCNFHIKSTIHLPVHFHSTRFVFDPGFSLNLDHLLPPIPSYPRKIKFVNGIFDKITTIFDGILRQNPLHLSGDEHITQPLRPRLHVIRKGWVSGAVFIVPGPVARFHPHCASGASSRTKSPLLPPRFSTRYVGPMTIALSRALHMS